MNDRFKYFMNDRFKYLSFINNHIEKSAEKEQLTYSGVMRFLNKKHPDKVLSFMKDFKLAFETALEEQLEDAEELSLMEAMRKNEIDNSNFIDIAAI